MLADKCIVEPQPVGKNDVLPVFLQRDRWLAMHGVHRHGEISESHVLSFDLNNPEQSPALRRRDCPLLHGAGHVIKQIVDFEFAWNELLL